MSFIVITRDQLRTMLADMVEANRGKVRPTEGQQLLDQLERALLEEDEIELGAAIAILHGFRVAGRTALALTPLLELAHEWPASRGRACRVCGCTEDRACPGGCSWVEYDLCSACVEPPRIWMKGGR